MGETPENRGFLSQPALYSAFLVLKKKKKYTCRQKEYQFFHVSNLLLLPFPLYKFLQTKNETLWGKSRFSMKKLGSFLSELNSRKDRGYFFGICFCFAQSRFC